MKNKLVKNTLILIITSLIIRLLSLFNRVILTRLLGNDGISLYVISLPSIMLYMSIAGFSLNTALAKVFAENSVTKRYSEKRILTVSITIGMITSAITSLLLVLTLKPLVHQGLKQPDVFYPILSCILFLPLVTLNNILRGYFNGKNRINISAYANLIEQVSRILIATGFLYLFLPYGLIVSVTLAIISMGLGEFLSLLYSLWKLKKSRLEVAEGKTESPASAVLNVAVPTTLSRLVGNLTNFFEPIIYTAALTILGFTSSEILYEYGEITAYAIPLITLLSFISQSIATAIIPNISKSNAENNIKEVNYYIKKSCLLSIIPGILVTALLMSYAKEYMLLVYDTELGSEYVIRLSAFFIVYYLTSPLYAIMQAVGRAKFLFRFSLITNILKLAMIFGFSFIPWISTASLMMALLINTILVTMIIYFYLKNMYHFRFSLRDIINILLLTGLTFGSLEIVKAGIDSYLLNTLIMIILFFLYAKLLKVASLHDK